MMEHDELMWFDRMPEMLPVYLRLKEKLEKKYGGAFSIRITKTQISFRNRYVFATASIPFRKVSGWPEYYLLVSFGLSYQKRSPRVAQSVEPYPNRWTHHVIVQREEEIDEELMDFLDEAYEFSMKK